MSYINYSHCAGHHMGAIFNHDRPFPALDFSNCDSLCPFLDA